MYGHVEGFHLNSALIIWTGNIMNPGKSLEKPSKKGVMRLITNLYLYIETLLGI